MKVTSIGISTLNQILSFSQQTWHTTGLQHQQSGHQLGPLTWTISLTNMVQNFSEKPSATTSHWYDTPALQSPGVSLKVRSYTYISHSQRCLYTIGSSLLYLATQLWPSALRRTQFTSDRCTRRGRGKKISAHFDTALLNIGSGGETGVQGTSVKVAGSLFHGYPHLSTLISTYIT